MPTPRRNSYEQLEYYSKYFDSFRNYKFADSKFIFIPQVPRLIEIYYKYLGLQYIGVSDINLLRSPAGPSILEQGKVFNKITKTQVRDWFNYVTFSDNVMGDEYEFFHCHEHYISFPIEARQPAKVVSDDELAVGKGYYKVCKACYKEGYFYKYLKEDLPGIGNNLAQIDAMGEVMEVHLLKNDMNDLMRCLLYGNEYADEYEKYNSFSYEAFFCHMCNRSLLNNITSLRNTQDVARECLSCYVDLTYSDPPDVDDGEGRDPDDREVFSHKVCYENTKEALGFEKSMVYMRWSEREKCKRQLFTESSILDWLNPREAKRQKREYQVRRLGELAVEALIKHLYE